MSEPQEQSADSGAEETAAARFDTVRFDDPDGGGQLASDRPLPPEAVEGDRNQHPPTDPENKDGNPASPTFLIGMAKWHPFMAFFHFLSDSLFPKSMPSHERIRGCRVMHPKLYKLCLCGDILVMVIILGFLLWVAILLTGKALA